MNENIDLTKILKDCPKGTVFWSDDYGRVEFLRIDKSLQYPILVTRTDGNPSYYTKEGWCNISFPASCLLWPSNDCRDWSKFTDHWQNNGKFDHNTLKPFDRVLVRDLVINKWKCGLFSDMHGSFRYPYNCIGCSYRFCIPYNDETKHLLGTTDEAPEYYRYW